MNELEKLEKRKKRTRHILITVSVLFLFLMLVLPLLCIIASSLKEGFAFYMQSIRTDYVKSALKVTLIATVAAVVINTFFGLCVSWLLTKFSFRGKQVLATLIDIPFSPGNQPVLWNEYQNRFCNSGRYFSNGICNIPLCIKGSDSGFKCPGQGRRGSSSPDGSRRTENLF